MITDGIEVVKLTDQTLLQEACNTTMRKGSSNISLRDIYKCEHSPIRTQIFWIRMFDIPSFVSVHFVRHKIGVEHFVQTNREDRGGEPDAGRWSLVNHGMLINAQALIQIARKRLCNQSHTETIKTMLNIKTAIAEVDPFLCGFLVPECIYRNGYCPELKPCREQPTWRG